MDSFLISSIKLFKYYKSLGDKAMAQLSEEQLLVSRNENSNSISIIVKHLHGNMMSRWTNFLSEDGEKEWRDRDGEFEDTLKTKEEILTKWEEGWACLFNAIEPLETSQLEDRIYIRKLGHSVIEAIQRQLGHYAYHVGQIVVIAKTFHELENWQSLSIPKGQSKVYNKEKFAQEKSEKHFTDNFLNKELPK